MAKKNLMLEVDECAKSKPDDYEQLRPYTVARLTYSTGDVEYTGVGFSKVRFPDEWNSEKGYEIARRNAVIHIVRQISGEAERYTLD